VHIIYAKEQSKEILPAGNNKKEWLHIEVEEKHLRVES